MNSNELFAKLVKLRNESGEALYARLCLAKTLLEDREWVEAPQHGGGDLSRAMDRLEAECFADICGALSLPQMLEILREVPQQKTWKASKYNLRAMYAEMQARRSPTPTTPRQPTTKGDQYEQLKLRVQELMEENKQLRKDKKELQARLDRIHKVLGIDQEAA